ncbi:FAD/NAD(P)-binding protein [Fodinicola acaciae]|uniref:FAD/NAD(P)-binding protein n=1 Tax=Fodinicola acaciae TaxID=2681555 RepID=UPI0013D16D34|nr:FAD/NAD(P)-binding protein [Fodinicola acaciae]
MIDDDGFAVVVVGAGASGALATIRLLRESAACRRPVRIGLVTSGAEIGRGPAYATMCDTHLLNVPAGKMSADPDAPDGFLDWLLSRGRQTGRLEFVPRWIFGAYLGDQVATEAKLNTSTASLDYIADRAIGVYPVPGGMMVELAGGECLRTRKVVLALGGFGPNRDWVPDALRGSPLLIDNPWDFARLREVPRHADVLLVGTGLTMCDVAVSACRGERTVYAVSRSGLLPHSHTTPLAAAMEMPMPAGTSLRDVRQVILRHVARSVRATGDWRPAMDGLRPLTTRIWQRFSDRDREDFLASYQRIWETHRHRIPPPTAAALAAAVDRGELEVNAAEVVAASQERGRVRVWLSNGRKLEVGAVVNCAGPEYDPRRIDDPLVRQLLDSGLARPGPQLLGLDTTDDGQLIGTDGQPSRPLWTIGSLRRGNLWETTAIPEIRAQAAHLARMLAVKGV